MGRVSGIDSGNETEEGSPDSDRTSVATTPHNFSDRINQDKVVIKPVAFKPPGLAKGNGPRYGSTPSLARPGSILTLYASSSDLRQRRNYSLDRKRVRSPLAMTSLPDSGHRSLGYDSLDSIYTSTPASFAKENYSRVRCDERNVCSDDLEAVLRERDCELQYLRETMEHNEQAIIRVYQEKERTWQREMANLRQVLETRLHKATAKSLRLEQTLIMHTYQLQEDKKRFVEELDKREEENNCLRKELESLRARLEETEWAICQKSGEVSLLKSQLKDSQGDFSTKCQEMVTIRNENRELRSQLEVKSSEIEKMTSQLDKKEKQVKELEIDNLKLTVQEINNIPEKDLDGVIEDRETVIDDDDTELDYKEEVVKLHQLLATERLDWEQERSRWASEKEKVLKYQRQLQINYVQMYKRTQFLEEELERCTQLDNAEEKLNSITSASIQL